ncbi:MAG: hypothetical protein WBJ21_15450 [Burkholderiaceae bacterium]
MTTVCDLDDDCIAGLDHNGPHRYPSWFPMAESIQRGLQQIDQAVPRNDLLEPTGWVDRHPVKRLLIDGCSSCGSSLVLCKCVRHLLLDYCCPECSH